MHIPGVLQKMSHSKDGTPYMPFRIEFFVTFFLMSNPQVRLGLVTCKIFLIKKINHITQLSAKFSYNKITFF